MENTTTREKEFPQNVTGRDTLNGVKHVGREDFNVRLVFCLSHKLKFNAEMIRVGTTVTRDKFGKNNDTISYCCKALIYEDIIETYAFSVGSGCAPGIQI